MSKPDRVNSQERAADRAIDVPTLSGLPTYPTRLAYLTCPTLCGRQTYPTHLAHLSYPACCATER